MINRALYGRGMRSMVKVLLVFIAVLTLYFTLITSMFDPEMGALLQSLTQTMPEIMAMVGMAGAPAQLTGFLANYLYGFLMLLFPLVFEILTANRLVARMVDRGSMVYLLASPNSRRKIAVTQLLVLLTGIVSLIVYCTGLGLACSEAMFPGELDIPAFLRLNLGVLALHLAVGGLCFAASCVCNDTRRSLAIGGGIPIAFYLLHMLANMGGRLEALRYVTVFTLFDTEGLLAGTGAAAGQIAALLAMAIVLYGAGVAAFMKRDLPL